MLGQLCSHIVSICVAQNLFHTTHPNNIILKADIYLACCGIVLHKKKSCLNY